MYDICRKDDTMICSPDATSEFCRTCLHYDRLVREEAEANMEREDYDYYYNNY